MEENAVLHITVINDMKRKANRLLEAGEEIQANLYWKSLITE